MTLPPVPEWKSSHQRPSRLPLALFILVPIGKDMPNPGAIRQPIHFFEILSGNLKRLGGNVGDVLPDQLARVDAGAVDFFEEKAAKGLDAGTEECAVEGDVDAFEGDGGKAALEVDGFGAGLGLLGACLDDFYQMGFYLFE